MSLTAFIETSYYLSGIGILFIGYKGLQQLTIGLKQVSVGLEQVSVAKMGIEIRSQREAALLAVKQADIFCNDIIPQWNKINLVNTNKSLKNYEGKIISFDLKESEIDEYLKYYSKNISGKFQKDEYSNFVQDNLLLANKLESLSIYFINGIADEKIVFNSIGAGYLEIVQQVYPFLCQLIKENDTLYTNLRELYYNWNDKTKELELKKQSEFITQQLETIKTKEIEPIGNKVS